MESTVPTIITPTVSSSLKWALESLSPLLRFEEITENEWNILRDQFERGDSPLLGLLETKQPDTLKNKKALIGDLGEEEANRTLHRLFVRLSQFMRCVLYAHRKTNTFDVNKHFILEFDKEMQVQIDPLYVSLIKATYATFDLKLRMYLVFMTLSNPIVLEAIKFAVDLHRDPKEILQILIRVLHDSYLVKRVEKLDETEEFKQILIPHLKMSQDIDNICLYQAVVTVLDLKIEKWEKQTKSEILEKPSTRETFVLTLSEEIIHKIRKDTAVSIDVRLPKTLTLTYDHAHRTLTFEGSDVPTSKLARGGIYLGGLKKIRALSSEEIKQTRGEKQIESTISAGFGVGWALKLLGAPGATFLLGHATVWWYFRTIKESE